MAKSKTNPKRKENVQKYKDSHKQKKQQQMAQSQSLPQIQQRPYWSSTEDLTIKGFEFEALVNYVNIAREAVQAADSALQRNIAAGKIKVKYFDENNNELNDEQVESITKLYQAYMQQLATPKKEAEPDVADAPKSVLVTETGEPLTSESPLRAI